MYEEYAAKNEKHQQPLALAEQMISQMTLTMSLSQKVKVLTSTNIQT